MTMFRKKPVVIEARIWGGSGAGAAVLQEWMSEFDRQSRVDLDDNGAPTLEIYTLEGWHHASSGDWIIKGVAGEFYPCKPEIFDATYEAAD